ncbi:MAG: hypothetical protein ACE5H9_09575 [Anaerolineae bacterium]
MKTMNDVIQANVEDFNRRTRSYLYEQWQRFTSPLPSAFRVGIWGTTGAGKTTYLAMLYDALLLRPGWTVAADPNARKFVTHHLRTIRQRGHFPAPTEIGPELDIFRYILQDEKTASDGYDFAQVALDFVDAPGEFYERPHQPDRRVKDGLDILDYLSSCHGIIFLLDPERTEGEDEDDEAGEQADDYRTLLLDLMMEFQERARQSGATDDLRLEQYMAFCVTKVDKEPLWGRRKSPQELAQEVMGDTMFRMLSANFCKPNRFGFFASSAVGRYQDPETKEWRENVAYPDQVRLARSAPAVTTTRIGQAYEPDQEAETSVTRSDLAGASTWAPEGNGHGGEEAGFSPVKIVRRQAIQPLNVIEPLDWLIESMRREPARIAPE